MDNNSGVGVLDKAVSVLAAVESGPATLAQLVAATGLARPTTHRIAVALEHHRLVTRDMLGRVILGSRIPEPPPAAPRAHTPTPARPFRAPPPPLAGSPPGASLLGFFILGSRIPELASAA